MNILFIRKLKKFEKKDIFKQFKHYKILSEGYEIDYSIATIDYYIIYIIYHNKIYNIYCKNVLQIINDEKKFIYQGYELVLNNKTYPLFYSTYVFNQNFSYEKENKFINEIGNIIISDVWHGANLYPRIINDKKYLLIIIKYYCQKNKNIIFSYDFIHNIILNYLD